ncbi:Cell wall-associated hydrolase, NlpC family [Nocardioides alpinus]|uniref:Cell wall-associated hydrolase, NlpC family n=1 Tax=Nocardioides alpinus TaxID=748909 RepID=A0A1I0V9R0_9ACTN|nr:C40 family peptidase [Nocardioides alpinus]PKH37146.1 NlpC/P60 family protein [Nocardioides alpinus]SFA73008.1 Cell wall-associated hydrolase, NlpC family [Nocardioides alpinus]
MPATSRTARACALALAGLGLSATTMTAPPATAADGATGTAGVTSKATAARKVSARVLSARDTALRQRGDAYAYGAAGPDRFDCSGLIQYSYRRAGFSVPRTSGAQAGFTRRIAKSDMRAGDLMFFYGSGGVYHAAIFLRWSRGHAVMVHSPGSGQRVRVAVPWTSSWFGGTLRRA